MPLFVASCIDKPGSLDLRMATREAHFTYWKERPGMLRLGGPFLDDKGDMAGSLMVIEAESLEAVKALNREDPYTRAGLFQSVDIRPWKATWGELP
jgi:uncharacterized protein